MNLRVFIQSILAIAFLLIFTGPAFTQANKTVSNGQTVPGIDFSSMGECVFNWTSSNPAIGLAPDGTGNIPSFTAINNGTTPITTTINVTPQNKGFAYIAQSSSNSVSVINRLTNSVSTIVPVGKNPGFVALSPDQSKVYVLGFGDSTITVINSITNTVINSFHVPQPFGTSNYNSLTVSKDGTNVLLGLGHFIYAFDAVTGQLKKQADMGANNTGAALSLDGTTLYTGQGTAIGLYDVNKMSFMQSIHPSSYGYQFFGTEAVLISKDSTKLYVLNSKVGQPLTIWALSLPYLQTINIAVATGVLANASRMIQSPDGRYIYINTTDDTPFPNPAVSYINVIDMVNYQQVANVPIPYWVTNMAITPDGSQIYLESRSSKIDIFDTKLRTITTTIPLIGPGNSIGNFMTGDCLGYSYAVTVNPNPVITTTGNLPALSTVYGTPSAPGSFTVSGTYITADILVTPPPGLEVSADNINFSKTITIAADNTGVVANAPVYIRLAKTGPAGTYSGNVTLTCVNTTVLMAQPASTVTPAPLVITADNKTQFYGLDVPPFTATYKGFVNNDTTQQLIAMPLLTTLANANSPAGQYPIMVSGAASPNYTFTYNPGVLTIVPLSSIFIPNTFTPNGDGINDTWNIKLINNYPDFTMQVFNRYGQKVYYSHNYPIAWDGTYKNAPLPFGTYYYVIALGRQTLSGHVTIVR